MYKIKRVYVSYSCRDIPTPVSDFSKKHGVGLIGSILTSLGYVTLKMNLTKCVDTL